MKHNTQIFLASVAMDMRDDPPTKEDKYPKPQGRYMKDTSHGKAETIWDEAVTPIALVRGYINKDRDDYYSVKHPDLTPSLAFDHADANKGGPIAPREIAEGGLPDFLREIAFRSKQLNRTLFPLHDPEDFNKATIKQYTKTIMAHAISDILSVWMHVWM